MPKTKDQEQGKDSEMECPEHNVSLDKAQTKHGYRHNCPVKGCTVVWWGKRNTPTTPANLETRQARMTAHAILDPLWKQRRIKRGKLYTLLAGYLGLRVKDTHIGLFNIEQCDKVIQFAGEIEP